VELNVSILPVVVVYLNRALQSLASDIDFPFRLPFSNPKLSEIHIDARDIDLKLTSLIETEGASGAILFVSCVHIVFN
jgi:hypothetical protein